MPWTSRIDRRWLLGWLIVCALGAALIVRVDIAMRRADFQAEARQAHRVLSQAAARLDAVLATVALLAPPGGEEAADGAEQRLPALYPQLLAAWRRDAGQPWPEGALVPGAGPQELDQAELRSRAQPATGRHPVLAGLDPARAQYTLVLADHGASFALRVDARRLAPAGEWPWANSTTVRATLGVGSQTLVLDAGAPAPERPFGVTDGFEARLPLASQSQPFVLHVQRFVGPAEWPWPVLGAWTLLSALLAWAAWRWHASRRERERVAALARMAQVSRLNTLGELAAGVAHELNQPLTAMLAGTQAALRVLRDEADADGAVADARPAMAALDLAAAQARRAADVVARLRRLVQPQPAATGAQPVDLGAVARRLLDLLEPELARLDIVAVVEGDAPPALGDPVAAEQILHNLLTNALQALEGSVREPRHLTVRLGTRETRVACEVRDNGPGVAPADLPRLFEPFFTTRPGGLGLGLPLCQSLALAMDGRLEVQAIEPHGTTFTLELPLAAAAGGGDTPPR